MTYAESGKTDLKSSKNVKNGEPNFPFTYDDRRNSKIVGFQVLVRPDRTTTCRYVQSHMPLVPNAPGQISANQTGTTQPLPSLGPHRLAAPPWRAQFQRLLAVTAIRFGHAGSCTKDDILRYNVRCCVLPGTSASLVLTEPPPPRLDFLTSGE